MKNKSLFMLLWLVAISFWACTKTEPFEAVPQNRITEYKVVNLQDTFIYGAVNNIENTITVYVPFYLNMVVIQPEITVESGAILETEMLPVELDNESQTYAVRAADGSRRTYKLIITQQNTPDLSLVWSDELPTGAPGDLLGVNNSGMPFSFLYGNFQSTSIATLNFAMIHRTTGDTLRPNLSSTGIEPSTGSSLPFIRDYYLYGITIPTEADSGYYDIEIGFLGHKELTPVPLHVVYLEPLLAPIWSPKVAIQGGEISFLPNSSPQLLFINPQSVTALLNGKTYDFAIQDGSTRANLVLKVPQDFPVGAYEGVPFTFQFGDWPELKVDVPLTITSQ
ncbi:hypothetical protein [Olivibacter domesticus]|uniref:DUF5018 domain-containing protein n=1 Tax=Olivibacter domesticus TaxID=407022 RepID=A0A1H7W5R1_OLID1|nr:hypothetical protein [Olivibacter domesticus]SEM16317.1 hypothetical protein SAMN05661044_04411 [Olivibacter domesticus]